MECLIVWMSVIATVKTYHKEFLCTIYGISDLYYSYLLDNVRVLTEK